ncbi:MAG TPA: NAD(P)/FAD-dependent oxidoreductase [Nitrospira sp.]|nr:NAD(P)/FAD-dependent oxidoreductase [Nitrospira sp.]
MRRLDPDLWDAVIVGGGLAGLSAAVYLGRTKLRTLLVDAGHSMARWEPVVENYLGFPDGISGEALLERGREQVRRFGTEQAKDEIRAVSRTGEGFVLEGIRRRYRSRTVLLATGLTHLLPDIPGAEACLGRSLLFCKDCDAYRMQGKRIAVYGRRNEAARYALAMLAFSPAVAVLTDGKEALWDGQWEHDLSEYSIPVRRQRIRGLLHEDGWLRAVRFDDGPDCSVDAIFATRGDVCHTGLAEALGAAKDDEGQLRVDEDMRTAVPGLYAAGCLTPANCQMIIAAGQGATAAQAINRDLFVEDLRGGSLPRADQCRGSGRATKQTV